MKLRIESFSNSRNIKISFFLARIHFSMQFQDLLQLLVEARAESDDEEDGQSFVNDPYKRKLSDVEIVRISISFLLAGNLKVNLIIMHKIIETKK